MPFPTEDSLTVLIRECVLDLLAHRPDDASVCPSEVARILGDELDVEWRDLMRPVRDVAARLADQGHIQILQSGHNVNIHQARGPVRLQKRARAD
jgi:Protein of unknown function (DUF3253)